MSTKKLAEIEAAYVIQAKLRKELGGWKSKLLETDQLLASQQETHQASVRRLSKDNNDRQLAADIEIARLQAKLEDLAGFKQQQVYSLGSLLGTEGRT